MNAVLYAVVVLIWGTTWIALKWQLGEVPIEQSIAYRFVLAAAILFAWLAVSGRLWRPRGRVALLVGLQGLCLFCLNFICFLKASALISSGLVAVVFSTASLWNAVLARVVLHREMSRAVVLGGMLGLCGLLLLFWPQVMVQGAHAGAVHGLLWALGGTLFFSAGNLLSSALQHEGTTPLQTNAWGMAVGACVLLAACLVEGHPFMLDMHVRYLGALLYLAVPGSVVAFTVYLTLLGRLGAERVAYCTVLFPIVALNVSAVFEGYRWSLTGLTGLALVLLGNVVVFGGFPAVRRRWLHRA